jgi:hypothetical protein
MSLGTAHHEAGHAMACEHFGLGWIIHAPDHEKNFMSRTDPVRVGGPLLGFTLQDAAVIAMSGWAAECHFLADWEDPYVREGAQHDFLVLDELELVDREPVTQRARELAAADWWRIEEVAAEVETRFG